MKVIIIFILTAYPIWAFTNKDHRIIGGTDAFAGEYPYAAAIYKTTADGNYFCTGSILTSQWVITAGQCVDGAVLFTILISTHKLNGDEATVEKLATDTYVLHPDYNPATLENDIGLIKFRAPITFTSYIKQLYLPYSELAHTTTGIAYGWGQTSDDDSSLSNTLHHVILSGVSDAECRVTYGSQISENMVCFEGNYNEGTCYGDSGSPVILHVSRGYTIILAIASFFSSNGCESTDPSGYTKVFPYNDWIRNVTTSG